MWEQFLAGQLSPPEKYEAWAFGASADELAQLVLEGKKTATASAYDLYGKSGEPLPKEDEYSVILDSTGEAVCIIRTTKVYVVPFCEVPASHAYKEGGATAVLDTGKRFTGTFLRRRLRKQGLSLTRTARLSARNLR